MLTLRVVVAGCMLVYFITVLPVSAIECFLCDSSTNRSSNDNLDNSALYLPSTNCTEGCAKWIISTATSDVTVRGCSENPPAVKVVGKTCYTDYCNTGSYQAVGPLTFGLLVVTLYLNL